MSKFYKRFTTNKKFNKRIQLSLKRFMRPKIDNASRFLEVDFTCSTPNARHRNKERHPRARNHPAPNRVATATRAFS